MFHNHCWCMQYCMWPEVWGCWCMQLLYVVRGVGTRGAPRTSGHMQYCIHQRLYYMDCTACISSQHSHIKSTFFFKNVARLSKYSYSALLVIQGITVLYDFCLVFHLIVCEFQSSFLLYFIFQTLEACSNKD